MIDRRSVCLGTAAAMVGASARAEPDKAVFTSGPMSRNLLAMFYKAPPASVVLPDTPLVSAEGPRKLSQLRGRTWLVSLWSEDCAPCLVEASDLAAVARTHAGPSFGVLFVLTGSGKGLDLAGAQAVLAKRGAGDMPLWIEPHGGARVMNALAAQDYNEQMRAAMKAASGVSLPCNLLVDRQGRVRARSFGAPLASRPPGAHDGPMTQADKAAALASQHTVWATPAGGEFAAALAADVLDKV